MQKLTPCATKIGMIASGYNDGRVFSDEEFYECLLYLRDVCFPLVKQVGCVICSGASPELINPNHKAIDQVQHVPARREFCTQRKNGILGVPTSGFPICHGNKMLVQMIQAWTTAEWGEESQGFIDTIRLQNFKRHHAIARKSCNNYK